MNYQKCKYIFVNSGYLSIHPESLFKHLALISNMYIWYNKYTLLRTVIFKFAYCIMYSQVDIKFN